MVDNPPETPKKGGRPPGPVTFAGQDAKKQRIFARFLNKHFGKTLRELRAALDAGEDLPLLEVMALRTLARAADKGDASAIELVLHTQPQEKKRKAAKDEKFKQAEPEEPALPDPSEFSEGGT